MESHQGHLPAPPMRFRRWKIILRLLALACSFIALWIGVGTAVVICNPYNYSYETENCGISDVPWRIICPVFSVIWNIMTLLRLLPLTKSFPARFRNPKLPSRPGWAVSFDLLLWMGLLGVGIYDMTFIVYDLTYFGEEEESGEEESGNAKLMMGVILVASILMLLGGTSHFIVFAFACKDEHTRRSGNAGPQFSVRAQELADRIIEATEKHAAMKEQRRKSSGKAPYMERGRTLSHSKDEGVRDAEQPLLGRRPSPDDDVEGGRMANTSAYGGVSHTTPGSSATLAEPFNDAYDDYGRNSWDNSFEDVSLRPRTCAGDAV